MRKLLFILTFLCAAQAISQTGIGTSQRQIKTPVGVSYYDSSMGWVTKDSIGVIREIKIYDWKNDRNVQSEVARACSLFTTGTGVINMEYLGNLTHSSSITIGRDSVKFIGYGTRINLTTATSIFATNRKNHLEFEGFVFVGDTSLSSASYAIDVAHSQGVKIHDNTFNMFTHSGVFLRDTAWYNSVTNNSFSNIWGPNNSSVGTAIFAMRSANYNVFSNNVIRGRGFTGIGLDDGSTADTVGSLTAAQPCLYNVVNGNDISGIQGSAGIKVEGSNYNVVTNNSVSNCYVGISLNNIQHRRSSTGNIINSNSVYGCSSHGIGLQGAISNIISNNFVENNGWTASPTGYGIILQYRAYAADSPTAGLPVDTLRSDSNSIVGNFIRHNARNGIYIDGTGTNGKLKYNIINMNAINDTNTSGSFYDNISDNGTSNKIGLNFLNTSFYGNLDSLTVPKLKSNINGTNTFLSVDDGSGNGIFRVRGGVNIQGRSSGGNGDAIAFRYGSANTQAGSVDSTGKLYWGATTAPDSSVTISQGASVQRLRVKQYQDFDSVTSSVSTKSGRLYSLGALGLFYYRGSTLVRIDSLIGGGGGGGDTIWARSGGFVYPVNTSDPVVIGGATGDSLFTVLGSSHLGGNVLIGGNISISGDLTAVGGLFTGEVTIADTAHFNSGTSTAGVASFLDSIYVAGNAKFRQIFTDSALVEGGIATLAAAGDSVRVTVSGMTPDGVAFANWADSTVNPFGVPNVTCHSGYIKIVSSFNEVSNIRVVYAYIRKQ